MKTKLVLKSGESVILNDKVIRDSVVEFLKPLTGEICLDKTTFADYYAPMINILDQGKYDTGGGLMALVLIISRQGSVVGCCGNFSERKNPHQGNGIIRSCNYVGQSADTFLFSLGNVDGMRVKLYSTATKPIYSNFLQEENPRRYIKPDFAALNDLKVFGDNCIYERQYFVKTAPGFSSGPFPDLGLGCISEIFYVTCDSKEIPAFNTMF